MMGLDLGNVVAYLRLDTSKFDAAVMNAQARVRSFASSMTKVGAVMTVGLTYPLYRFGKAAVSEFAKFDDALTRSAAVTKGMSAVMRKEMGKTAIEISRKSLLPATELAEGYFALGQAGYSAAQSIKALPVVENFAIASTISLDEAIRYLVRTVNGLNMATEDPVKNMQSLKRVSDAFTYAAITTTAEIRDFAVAMTHAAAPALRLVNKSIEEGVSVLMAFASAGIQSEEAGTLLWTTVRDLQRANIKARAEWDRLGLSIYSTTGKMRNLGVIFGDLEKRFMGMSDEGKKVSLMLLGFQDRSLRGIQALMGFSEQIIAWERAMRKGGDLTKQIADAYMKSFNAQLVKARNNIRAFYIVLGRTLAPMIMKINKAIEQFSKWWDTISDETKLIIVEFGILAATLGPLLLILSRMVMTITYLSIGFNVWVTSTIALAKAFALVAAAAGGTLAVLGFFVGTAYAVRAAWKQNLGKVRDIYTKLLGKIKSGYDWLANSVIGEFLFWMKSEFGNTLREIGSDFNDWFAERSASFKASIGFWRTLLKSWQEDSKDIARMSEDEFQFNYLKKREERMKNSLKEARETYSRIYTEAMENYEKTGVTAVDKFVAGAKGHLKTIPSAIVEYLGEARDALKKQFGEDVSKIFGPLINKIKTLNKSLMAMLPSEVEQKWINFVEQMKKAREEMDNLSEAGFEQMTIWGRHMNAAISITERFQEVATRAFDDAADALTEFVSTGTTDIKRLAAAILSDLLNAIIRAQMAAIFLGKTMQPSQQMGELLGSFFTNLFGGAASGGGQGKGAYGNMYSPSFPSTNQVHGYGNMYNPAFSTPDLTNRFIYLEKLGDVFNRGNIIPMALGNIINAATLVPMAQKKTALIGEAGPEAVMPLTRTPGGELGVRAQQPEISLKTKIVNVYDREEQLAAMRSDKGEKVIMNILRRNGVI